MPDITALVEGGMANVWLIMPSAILLGILHGLEPGHSKTVMAAFIVAIRGTALQAMLLGLAATVSHTAVVWAIALAGLHFGAQWNSEGSEPYLQLASAALIISVALWMAWRTWREQRAHAHHHHDETQTIDTGHGLLALEIFEDGVPPRWRLHFPEAVAFAAGDVALETARPDGVRQVFTFQQRDGFLESAEEIPEPHAFTARLYLSHGDQGHHYDLEFREYDHSETNGLNVDSGAWEDAHERGHAADIRQRFANRHVTTGQIVMFGLTGGLIPCPASIAVLLLCLQLKEVTLGAMLVLCFSIGLAVTMVAVGTAAALSAHHVSTRWTSLGVLARRAPYLSSALIVAIGLYTGYSGWAALAAQHS